jgi:exodeoxyribonuclease VII small subunit
MKIPPEDVAHGAASPSFEDAMIELETIVSALESGSVSLDQSLALVRRGQELATLCDATLQQAELTLSTLVATDEGELIEQGIEWENE